MVSQSQETGNRKAESFETTQVKFMKIPVDDLAWVREQKPTVLQLFLDCWSSDPYGSRWVQLSTKLKPSAFREAKKTLSNRGLFVFKRETSILDARSTVCWLVKNLHGSRVKEFWNPAKQEANPATHTANNATHRANNATHAAAISLQTQSEQGFQNASRSSQEHFKSVLEKSRANEAAYEGAASSAPPELESPAVTDCTAASSVEEEVSVKSSASLPDQTEVTSEERQDPDQGQCSAAAAIEEIKAKLGIKAPARAVEAPRMVVMTLEEKAAYMAQQRALAARFLQEESATPPEGDAQITGNPESDTPISDSTFVLKDCSED